MAEIDIFIESAPLNVAVDSAPIVIEISAAPGVPGPAGPVGPNSVTSVTTSNGTADLDLLNVDTVTATVSGTLTASHIHGNLAGSVYAHIRAGEALTKGDPVYVSGFHPGSSTAEVMKADASNAAKMPAVGIMDANVAHNNNGHMVIVGNVIAIDTSTFAVNAELYVKASGGLTATPPTARAQAVARVERVNAINGAIFVKVNGLSASDATASTLVRRTSGGASSFTGITNNGLVTLSTGTTFSYAAGVPLLHRTALQLGSLATQSGSFSGSFSGTFNGTFSGNSTGTNTGDQDLSSFLSRISQISVIGTTPSFNGPLADELFTTNGRRRWSNGAGEYLEFDGSSWILHGTDGMSDYDAYVSDQTQEPWKIDPLNWIIVNGTDQPYLSIEPYLLVPVDVDAATIAVTTNQDGRVAPSDMASLGIGVADALGYQVDTPLGFLTAGLDGVLPISMGGTGSSSGAVQFLATTGWPASTAKQVSVFAPGCTPSSQITVSWANSSDTDENSNETDFLQFRPIPETENFILVITSERFKFGGDFKLKYTFY